MFSCTTGLSSQEAFPNCIPWKGSVFCRFLSHTRNSLHGPFFNACDIIWQWFPCPKSPFSHLLPCEVGLVCNFCWRRGLGGGTGLRELYCVLQFLLRCAQLLSFLSAILLQCEFVFILLSHFYLFTPYSFHTHLTCSSVCLFAKVIFLDIEYCDDM